MRLGERRDTASQLFKPRDRELPAHSFAHEGALSRSRSCRDVT